MRLVPVGEWKRKNEGETCRAALRHALQSLENEPSWSPPPHPHTDSFCVTPSVVNDGGETRARELAEALERVRRLSKELEAARQRMRDLESENESLQSALSLCTQFDDHSVIPTDAETPFRSYRSWETPREDRIFRVVTPSSKPVEAVMLTPLPNTEAMHDGSFLSGEAASKWLDEEQRRFERG